MQIAANKGDYLVCSSCLFCNTYLDTSPSVCGSGTAQYCCEACDFVCVGVDSGIPMACGGQLLPGCYCYPKLACCKTAGKMLPDKAEAFGQKENWLMCRWSAICAPGHAELLLRAAGDFSAPANSRLAASSSATPPSPARPTCRACSRSSPCASSARRRPPASAARRSAPSSPRPSSPPARHPPSAPEAPAAPCRGRRGPCPLLSSSWCPGPTSASAIAVFAGRRVLDRGGPLKMAPPADARPRHLTFAASVSSTTGEDYRPACTTVTTRKRRMTDRGRAGDRERLRPVRGRRPGLRREARAET